MKRVIIIFGCLSFFIFFTNQNQAYSYYDCSGYGPFAYSDGTGYCKCSYGYVMSSFLGGSYCVSIEQYCRDKYGYNATSDYLTNECKCVSGHSFGKDMFGNTSCVNNSSLCQDSYGINSEYDSSSGKCRCKNGYSFSKDMYGETECISNNTFCNNNYGSNSRYNSLSDECECLSDYSFGKDMFGETKCISNNTICQSNYGYDSEYDSSSDKCECRDGYEFTLKTSGGLECESCSSKYGYYSSYNSSEKECECMSGYTLDDNSQCVKKQNNVYFRLTELDLDNNRVLIKNEHDNKYYLVVYKSDCYNYSFKKYLNKQIVVNLGTDFFVDRGDKIVLQDDGESCEIKDFEKVNSDFSFFENKKENNVFSVPTDISINSVIDNSLSNKLKGRILLQVESSGEGWYVNPENSERYFLGRPSDAFNVMRSLGLGISNKDFDSFNGFAPKRLSGRILLKVEDFGKAYYVNPVDLKMHFLGRPSDAFEVMRNLGLGISNNDISKIDIN